MSFLSPEFLYTYPILLAVVWLWKKNILFQPLRLIVLTSIIIALARPQLSTTGEGLELWVIADRSDSIGDTYAKNQKEWLELIQKNKSSRDKLHLIDYASDAIRKQPGAEDEKLNTTLSNLGKALRYTASLTDSSRANRFLVLSDGYSSDSLAGIQERLQEQKIPLDYRLIQREKSIDFSVSRFRLPPRIQPGEAFLMETEFLGSQDGPVNCIIKRNNLEVFKGEINIENGKGRLRLFDRLAKGGSHLYKVQIEKEGDSITANNSAETWVQVTGGQKVILLSSYTNDPIKGVLERNGFDVMLVNDASQLSPQHLNGSKLVLFNNIPAWQVNNHFIKALDFYVRYQGGGLIMAGGEHSFGSGAYAQTTVEKLMPVSMELKIEHRKLQVAMSIVMDRSGSMSMPADNGRTKIDLANDGAARTVDLLADQDYISIFAVDSTAHKIVPQQNIGGNRIGISRKARSIISEGGGIFVYEGLKAAWKELQTSPTGQKHIILFSDAADSEQPGQYKHLIQDMRSAGATVSVIALGTDKDSDANFLKDIAKRGDGRIFFTTDPMDVPAFFAQEAVAVARSSFVKETTTTSNLSSWNNIARKTMTWPSAIDGYNINYSKENSENGLICNDEYSSPLISWWPCGSGKTAAVAFPLGGQFSQRIRQWNNYGDFIQSLSRWVAAPQAPSGISLQHRFEGNTLFLQLYFSEEWRRKFTVTEPKIFTYSSSSKNIQQGQWHRQNPGLYQSRYDLKSGEALSGVVQFDGQSLNFGPFTNIKNSEWDFNKEKIQQLADLSSQSGGQQRLNLSEIWQRPEGLFKQSISSWFLLVAAFVALIEFFTQHTGSKIKLPKKMMIHSTENTKDKRTEVINLPKRTPDTKPPEDLLITNEEVTTLPITDEKRQNRYRRAKK